MKNYTLIPKLYPLADFFVIGIVMFFYDMSCFICFRISWKGLVCCEVTNVHEFPKLLLNLGQLQSANQFTRYFLISKHSNGFKSFFLRKFHSILFSF